LNTVLKKFVRDKQTPETIASALEQMRHMAQYVVNSEPQPFVAPQLAEFFILDALRAVAALEVLAEKKGVYDVEDVLTFTTQAHAMKNALINVGEPVLSAYANRLEQAGWKKDTAAISAEIPAFLSKLRDVIARLTPKADEDVDAANCDYDGLREKMLAVKDACAVIDNKTAKSIIVELRKTAWSQPIKGLLGDMAEHLLSGDFDEVARTADKICEAIP
jgi:HPt (histidine-containing phosphotransfer) domain-containing protein